MKSWAWATRAAASISASLASGRAKAMFSRIVAENRKLSSNTTLTAERSDDSVKSRTSVPSKRTVPLRRVVEAGDQERQRGLARTRCADEPDALAGSDRQRDVVQRRRARRRSRT